MFTGIIEQMGTVTRLKHHQTNLDITIKAKLTPELKIDQSVAHNGVCLTVVAINNLEYTVTAIKETLDKTNLAALEIEQQVNLERCMIANARFDGHMVQGHVDTTALCKSIEDQNGSWLYTFELQNPSDSKFIVNKGSICINGISLTVVNSTEQYFSVAIIPYTFNHTNMQHLVAGMYANIEFDIIGKYIAKQTGY